MNGPNLDDKQATSQPSSELDLYDEAVHPTVSDEFLAENNLGLGNYTEREMWQQIQSFAEGLFGDSAFARILNERTIKETKRKLATEGIEFVREDGRSIEFESWEEKSKWESHERRQAIRERGDEVWHNLDEEDKVRAIAEKVGGGDWTPPQWRMLMMRHEGSRSRDAQTLDNLFGRVQEHKVDEDSADALEGEI
jgi:hypothetical protein